MILPGLPQSPVPGFEGDGFLFVLISKNDMASPFKIGDHVSWIPIAIGTEAGHVSGTIIKIHKADFNYKGYTHHATDNDPQYEIKSDKTDHIAVIKVRH